MNLEKTDTLEELTDQGSLTSPANNKEFKKSFINTEKKEFMGKIKEGVQIFLAVLALNYLPASLGANLTSQIYRGNIPKTEYNNFITNDNRLDAKDYFNLACSLTEKFKKENYVCRHLAGSIYEAYLNLVRKNGRKDLEDKIRLIYGDPGIKGVKHVWLEINDQGKWVSYDSWYSRIPIIDKIEGYNSENYPQPGIDYDYEPEFKTIPGKRIIYPRLKDIVRNGSVNGIIDTVSSPIIHSMVKNFIKKNISPTPVQKIPTLALNTDYDSYSYENSFKFDDDLRIILTNKYPEKYSQSGFSSSMTNHESKEIEFFGYFNIDKPESYNIIVNGEEYSVTMIKKERLN